jgi:hypothetical protein
MLPKWIYFIFLVSKGGHNLQYINEVIYHMVEAGIYVQMKKRYIRDN